jgi:hypothetical protein
MYNAVTSTSLTVATSDFCLVGEERMKKEVSSLINPISY